MSDFQINYILLKNSEVSLKNEYMNYFDLKKIKQTITFNYFFDENYRLKVIDESISMIEYIYDDNGTVKHSNPILDHKFDEIILKSNWRQYVLLALAETDSHDLD